MKQILALVGRSKSGKDEFYNIAKSAGFRVHRIAIADMLKQMTAKLLDVSVEEINSNKEVYRNMLIFGGSLAREIDQDYWVKLATKNIGDNLNELSIITDVRFVNELHYIERLNYSLEAVGIYTAKNILLSRGYSEKFFNHKSETLIDDYLFFPRIVNNGTLEEYRDKVIVFLNKHYPQYGV